MPRGLYGFSTENARLSYGFQDSVFLQAAADLRPALLRFPGGTSANYYHWQSGTFAAGLDGDSLREQPALAPPGKGRVSFDDFVSYCKRFGIRPVVVVNIFTGTPEESAAWVRYARDQGFAIRDWEIGNEIYLSVYRKQFPTPASYLAVA